jgi:hypothetical protein
MPQTNQTNQTNQNNTGTYLLFGGVSLLILGFIFVFWILPMFQKNLSVDCSGNWTIWSECDATCDGSTAISSNPGTRKRTYIVKTPASNQGASCPISPETGTCTKIDCPVNCMGNWDRWTDCDATCDGIDASRIGTRKRTYTVTTPASNQGASCPISQETVTCIKIDCPVNCIGNWDRWTDCDATCDGINASRIGTRKRTYTVTTPASNRGVSCPISPETETCTKTNCPINCIVNWDRWSACNATCDGINASVPGTKTRTYTVITYASNDGIRCPISPETETCIKTDCIVPLGTGIITGNILNSTDKYMIFTTNTNTFTVPSSGLNCDILMIGGGGSGGQYGGGGSGACIIAINQTLPSGVCSVVVGSAGTTSTIAGNSSITINDTNIRYTAIGGGRGGNTSITGSDGGCGGGGREW